jgi:hypothetical protein
VKKATSLLLNAFLIIGFLGTPAHAEIYKGQILGDPDPNFIANFMGRDVWAKPSYSAIEKKEILAKYNHLDPQRIVPTKALEEAVLFFNYHRGRLNNKNYISIINYKPHATKARYFLLDMKSGRVQVYHVAHGKNSDPDNDGYATRFSNVNGSLMSSLGFMFTQEEYQGGNGLSLRLSGVSDSNYRVRERLIVVHGSNYIGPGKDKPGRSWGCPAINHAYTNYLINRISYGSLIYAYSQ